MSTLHLIYACSSIKQFSPEAVVKSCKTSVTVGLIAPMVVVVTEFTKETKKEAIKKLKKTPMLTSKTHILLVVDKLKRC